MNLVLDVECADDEGDCDSYLSSMFRTSLMPQQEVKNCIFLFLSLIAFTSFQETVLSRTCCDTCHLNSFDKYSIHQVWLFCVIRFFKIAKFIFRQTFFSIETILSPLE